MLATTVVVFDKELVAEAEGIVTVVLLNGPLKGLTRGVPCPSCSEEEGFARLTDVELRAIAREAVSKLFRLLWLRDNESESYQRELRRASAAGMAGVWEESSSSADSGGTPERDEPKREAGESCPER